MNGQMTVHFIFLRRNSRGGGNLDRKTHFKIPASAGITPLLSQVLFLGKIIDKLLNNHYNIAPRVLKFPLIYAIIVLTFLEHISETKIKTSLIVLSLTPDEFLSRNQAKISLEVRYVYSCAYYARNLPRR
jgi:hypothetical protein